MYSWPLLKRLNFCHIIHILMDRNLLRSDVTSLGKQFLMFQSTVVPLSSGTSSPRTLICLTLKMEAM